MSTQRTSAIQGAIATHEHRTLISSDCDPSHARAADVVNAVVRHARPAGAYAPSEERYKSRAALACLAAISLTLAGRGDR